MTKNWTKFSLLMWKNWTLIKRNPCSSIVEIIIPILSLAYVLMMFAMPRIDVRVCAPVINDEPNESEDRTKISFCSGNDCLALYSPISPLLKEIVQNMWHNTKGYETEEELNKAIKDNMDNIGVAIKFDDSLAGVENTNGLPENLEITIRLPVSDYKDFQTQLLFPPKSMIAASFRLQNSKEKKTFLRAQEIVTKTLLHRNDNYTDFKIDPQAFPISFETCPLYTTSITFMYLNLGFITTVVFLTKHIAAEKELQLKESMKIMGLPGWLHWLAWFTRSLAMLVIPLIAFIVAVCQIFPLSDPSLIVLFYLFLACSLTTYSFMISVFFSRATSASIAAGIFFYMAFLPSFIVILKTTESFYTASTALGCSILFPTAANFLIDIMTTFQYYAEGVQWNNLFSPVNHQEEVAFGQILLMLFGDTLIYLIIALYVEAIFPGEFGMPQPWYFPFTRSFWCGKKTLDDNETPSTNKGPYFEEVREDSPVGIRLQNLSKTFGSHQAVKEVNLEMYEGHITVLLGHNGAGKSTTMNMICGMFPPTKGTAFVSSYDVRKNVNQVRDSMGICLQHNVLFRELTVWEHLYFFAILKGLKKREANKEINEYLRTLDLMNKRNARSKNLSGGMKRKLCVGIAYCGNSKIVILDEPTSGMDPEARRAIWDFLQKRKSERTVLLTTHFMDEADILGDRIAIMAVGEIKCCGSSLFLKRKYGLGYSLIIETAPRCQPQNITDVLRKYIPNAQVHSLIGSQLTYRISDSESWKFENMFYDLESNSNSLGIQSFGVAVTTLEEVFLKVGVDHDKTASKALQNKNKAPSADEESGRKNLDQINYASGIQLLGFQLLAMFYKKMWCTIRTWYLLVLSILFIFICLIIFLPKESSDNVLQFPALKLTLDAYGNPVTLVQGRKNEFYKAYKEILKDHTVKEVTDIAATIKGLPKPMRIKNEYIVGASFDRGNNLIAHYNPFAIHSKLISVGLLLNAVYKTHPLLSKKSITFINHPLPMNMKGDAGNIIMMLMSRIMIVVSLGLSIVFAAALFVMIHIKERGSKFKHLQFVSGLSSPIYWGATFVWDFIIYLIIIGITIFMIVLMKVPTFEESGVLRALTVVFIYFGICFLPLLYLVSYIINDPAKGFMFMSLPNFFLGILLAVIVQGIYIAYDVGQLRPNEEMNLWHPKWVLPVEVILLLIPSSLFLNGMFEILMVIIIKKISAGQESLPENEIYYRILRAGIGRHIIIAFAEAVLFWVIITMLDFKLFAKVDFRQRRPQARKSAPESDVTDEISKIHDTPESSLVQDHALVLRDVTKYYKKFLAVNGLCLAVKEHECFGLLGANGAGKTSTFEMITGDLKISHGNIWIKGKNLRKNPKGAQKEMGYCPQFDAVLDILTVREAVKIFALIRGVPLKQCNAVAESLAEEFDYTEHVGKKYSSLSGGTKRKVSTSLAFLGDPSVIFLDEPTTGMDPASKRLIWNALEKRRASGKCIILTSHSMEECENLCTRLVIMTNGEFQCLGSVQRLKNKFAQGFDLTIKLNKTSNLDDNVAAIQKFIDKNFPGSTLQEQHHELLVYRLGKTQIPWSKLFGLFEKNKKSLNIEIYTLQQCSLEDVFLNFTQKQR